MSTTEQQLKNLYSKQLAIETDQLQADYAAADAEYDAQKQANQKNLDQNLNRTAVEAQKAAVNQSELHNAYGLSSGAAAQARLALENQKATDMAALRQSGQEQDAQLERQRAAMAQQYQSEIRRAQQENDLALAEALYENARKEQEKLEAKASEDEQYAWTYAQIMMEAGDYTPAFNFLRSKGVNATYDQLVTLMGEYAPAASSLTPLSTAATRSFISSHSTWAQAKARGMTEEAYKNMITSGLAGANLTDEEFAALEAYYGIS